jgi:hypothetical protein
MIWILIFYEGADVRNQVSLLCGSMAPDYINYNVVVPLDVRRILDRQVTRLFDTLTLLY